MLLILITNLSGGLIILKVIVLHAEGQSALSHIEDILCSVLLVGTKTGTIELKVAILSHLQLDGEELLHGLGRLEGFQLTHHRLKSLLLTAYRVHRHLIEVGEFLLGSALGIGVIEQLGENTVDTLVVVLAKAVERAEA